MPLTAEVGTNHQRARERWISPLAMASPSSACARTSRAAYAGPLYLAEVSKQVGERDVGSRGEMLHVGNELVV